MHIIQHSDTELKVVACFVLKNLLFRCSKDVKTAVNKELTSDILLSLLSDENQKLQEQALMIYRNLLSQAVDIDTHVLDEAGDKLLHCLELNLDSSNRAIVLQTLYVLSNIANGNAKYRKIAFEDRYFTRALQLLKSTESKQIRIGVLNYIINLAFKDGDNKIKK